jgi:hypothetical protein
MCMGGGGGSAPAQKIDPTPTVVTPSEVQAADSSASERKERRKSSRARNVYSEDRGTILGSLMNSANNSTNDSGTRNKLG